jgi:hypothetical protein
MAEEQPLVIATELSEIDPQKIFLSAVLTHKWSYKSNGRNVPYVHVFYEKPKQTLCILMEDVRINSGIQTSAKYPNLMLMSQSKMLREKIEDQIAELLFEVRHQLH